MNLRPIKAFFVVYLLYKYTFNQLYVYLYNKYTRNDEEKINWGT